VHLNVNLRYDLAIASVLVKDCLMETISLAKDAMSMPAAEMTLWKTTSLAQVICIGMII
jgi:hypothetical protein